MRRLPPSNTVMGSEVIASAREPGGKVPLRVPVIVATVALLVEGGVLLGSRLVVTPDASGYVDLAAGIAERLDFDGEWFTVRSYGYPLLIAGVFRWFGGASPTAILILQHGMVVACAILTGLLAWLVRPRTSFALTAGLLGAFSLHLSGYANTVLTEVPYTLGLTSSIYLVLRYWVYGRRRLLAYASLAAGVTALIRPTGQLMLGVCVLVGLVRTWRERMPATPGAQRGRMRPLLCIVLAATLPGVIIVLPAAVHNYRIHGFFGLSVAGRACLYIRAVFAENLDSPTSPAMASIRSTFEEARRRGLIDETVSYRQAETVVDIYQQMHQTSLVDIAYLLERAGRDIMLQHPWLIMRRTFVHAYRTLLIPDALYRFQPGGSPGRDNRMREGAVTFAVDTYLPLVTRRAGAPVMSKYLPITNKPTILSSSWGRLTRWYHRRVERGPSLTGLADTPYEEFALLCILGGVVSLVSHNRAMWLLLGFIVTGHVMTTAFFQGTNPRYAVPLHPLLHVFGALSLTTGVDMAIGVIRFPFGGRWRGRPATAGWLNAAKTEKSLE